jgi:hypothetical protein
MAKIPLKVTVLVGSCESPNLYPEIVTDAPTNPSDGRKDVITGLLKGIPLLGRRPGTVTVTLPAVAPVGTVTTI